MGNDGSEPGASPGDAAYILGHDKAEQRRLLEQAEFLEPLTRRFLLDAGLASGMRVLDVGSGVGDVALLAGRLVGPAGRVVGVERERTAAEQATGRAARSGASNVSFATGDVRDVDVDGPFDAVIGRFVLMYLGDLGNAIGAAARHVRPGGIVAFQEWHADDLFLAEPPVPLWQRTGDIVVATFRRAGTNTRAGFQLRQAFEAAGLPSPDVRAERPAGGGAGYDGYRYLAGVITSIAPMIEHYGIANLADLDLDTLEDRLRADAGANDATVTFPSIVSAWTTRPLDDPAPR
jgi:SAM-dependent methyltransferase